MLLAVPNVSEGRDIDRVARISAAFATGAALLDTHSDPVHNRTVLTLSGSEGSLVSASGEDGARLMELLTAHGGEGTHVAELGVGTNEKAILSGEVLEDEKLLGTVHVAFGASAAIGGTIQVPVHLDCVVMEPDLVVDGTRVVENGSLLV